MPKAKIAIPDKTYILPYYSQLEWSTDIAVLVIILILIRHSHACLLIYLLY